MLDKLICSGIVAAVLLSAQPSAFAQATSQPEVKHDVSGPLSAIPAPLPMNAHAKLEQDIHRVKSIRPANPAAAAARRPVTRPQDAARQSTAPHPFQPATLPAIPGISSGKNGFIAQSDPPDTNAAVGRTQIVEWVNTSFAVFDKQSGALQGNILPGSALFKNFGGDCQNFNDGDPIVGYDKLADRWVLSQFAITGGENGGGTFSYCVAVSQTPDALGQYNRYEFQFPDFNDYPKMSVWPDGYYVSFNMFHGEQFNGAKVCALPRTNMLAGQTATMQCFDVANQGGLLPADLDGKQTPPAGTPNYVLNFDFDGTHLNLWKFHVDWSDASKSTFTKSQITVSPFTPACDGCIPEPSGGSKLQSLGDRLMYRLAYRQFADHDSLVVNHAVSISGDPGPTGIRWYEIRNLASTPVVAQQSTFAPDSSYRWMASAGMDKVGNLLIGYTVSSTKRAPGIAFTGRMVSDPPGQLSAEKLVALTSTGVQTDPDRWGDYASVTVDPVDDCTFYFATQFVPTKGHFNWQTQISRFKFPNCQ